MTTPLLPTPDDVLQAADRLRGVVHRTPVLRSSTLDRMHGAQFHIKCENLQRSGTFKFRGAYHTLSRLTPAQQRAGVLTYSAGNHAQAIALAARLLDMPALILMPEDAPTSKMAATREYGAQVVTYNPLTEDREAICVRLAQERGMTLVPPSDHPDVIAGQGTAALELLQEVPRLDYLFVGVGGGGQIAGSALAVQALGSDCQVIGVEPEAANDAQQSLRQGTRVQIPFPRTIADGAQAQALSPMAFALMRERVQEIVTVSDPQLMQTMRFFAERMKTVAEPTGALALAGATLAGFDGLRGKRVGVILSGGNVDLPRLARFLADH